MKKENEGYFVIKFKNKEKYITDSCFYTNLIEDAKPFETETKAYKYMRENNLDKEYVIKKKKKKGEF